MVSSKLSEKELLELYNIVFKSKCSDGFKIAEIKDFLDDSMYVAVEPFKKDWKENAIKYLNKLNISWKDIQILQ